MNDVPDLSAQVPRVGTRLFISGLGIGQICSWGSLYYSFPLIAEAMGKELGYTKPELYGGATLGLVLCGMAAYPVGVAIDRGHGRTIMVGGSLLAGLLLFAWSQVQSLAVFYAIFAGIGLLHAATLYEPAFAVIARRFGSANARSAITEFTLWGGFASTVFIPLVQISLDYQGWRGTLLALGAVNILLCAGLYAMVIDPKADVSEGPAQSSPQQARQAAVRAALRSPVFWALAAAFTGFAATFTALTIHLYPLLLERGFDTATVVVALMIIGPAQVAGRVLVWVLAREISVRIIGSVVVVVLALAPLALQTLPPSFALVALVAVLYGASNGIMTIVRGMAVPEMLTRESYGAINGALAAPSMVARAMAPLGAAAIWAAAGSYDAVLWAVFACSLLVVVAFWTAAVLSRPTEQL